MAALAAEVFGEDPFSGVVLVFRAKRGDRVKIVHWDTSGLVLVWKQLEGGAFRWPHPRGGAAPGLGADVDRYSFIVVDCKRRIEARLPRLG